MGYFAALAITLFLAAFVLIINGGVQMVICFPIYKIIFPEGEQIKN